MLLSQPIALGNVELKNRVVCTAHLAFPNAYLPGETADDYLAYLGLRAAGGVAMLTLQTLRVRPISGDLPFAFDYLSERLRRIGEMAHDYGVAVVMQLQHFGAKQRSDANPDLEPLWALSPLISTASGERAHAMTTEEVGWLVEGYGRAAELVARSGLDGVELAGSHGYLLYQSISPIGNDRQDDWGGHLTFWHAVLRRVRQGIGDDKILGARVCSDDLTPPPAGLGRDRLRDIAVELAATGLVDYLNPTEGSQPAHYPRIVGTFRRPHGDFLAGAAAIRAALTTPTPVVGVGRITSAEEAEAALQRGDCDLVGMTRAHIADPDIMNKLARGEHDRIRPCVGANQGCIDRVNKGYAITCFHNPDVGREHRLEPLSDAERSRRVAIIGAGPAGMKAAETAARRGHDVTLFDRVPRLGGRLGAIGKATAAHELLRSIDWLAREIDTLRVDIRLSTEVDTGVLRTVDPDVIVLATGSQSCPPPFSGDGSIPVLSTDQAVDRAATSHLGRVLVYDEMGNEEMDVTCEQLAASGATVTIVSPHAVAGAYLGHTHEKDFIDRMLQLGVRIEERTELLAVTAGLVTTRSKLQARQNRRPFDCIVHAAVRLPDQDLRMSAESACAEVHVIGDAVAPRTAMHAFREGANVGRRL